MEVYLASDSEEDLSRSVERYIAQGWVSEEGIRTTENRFHITLTRDQWNPNWVGTIQVSQEARE